MDRLWQLVPAPQTRLPGTLENIGQLFIPPILLYYAHAVLVLIPGTLYARMAILPLTLWTAFRASTRLDFALAFDDDRLIYLNHGLLLTMTTLAFRALVWSFEAEPYFRVNGDEPLKKGESKPLTLENVAKDALDLTFNLRGLGWSWSERLFVPEETRPTESRTKFLLSTLYLLLTTTLAFDFLHFAIQCLGPTTFGTAQGGTIFDPALPPLQRYLLSSFISLLAGGAVICGIQIGYYFCTIIGVGLLQNEPSSWPPAFDKPWVSTSLNEFWTRRWHQSFRDIFVGAGSKPLHYFFGKPGIVAGAFLVSGILHVFGLWGMGRGTEFWSVAGYFLLMGVGLVLEHVYRAVSGKRVGGYPGQIWTLLWVVGWGNLLVDAWFRKGLGGSAFFPDALRPVTIILKAIR